MRWFGLIALLAVASLGSVPQSFAQTSTAPDLRVYPPGQLPDDPRLGELRTLNDYFPFRPVENVAAWTERQAEIRRRILVSQGLWPLPTRSPLKPVIHGRVDRDDYVVDRVFFESIPGHYVTGSLYRPKNLSGPVPAILSPHGHWKNGRFYDAGASQVKADLENGAEKFEVGGRYPIQARAVHLARMGCIVFVYDMTGNADSIQLPHRPDRWSHLDRPQDWGFMSVQADLRLQNMMGLQTWNSIRAIDFLTQLDDVDASRIGVTGASGGGTQSMIIAAIDQRIAAAMPCVMVSTSMQGGCTCENAPLLRIDQGNVDIAAAVAPRPLGLTAADDWTVELQTKGYPGLVKLYTMLGHPENLTAVFHTRFPHNYNYVNRAAMYQFFNRHFELGIPDSSVEQDFDPLTVEEATVWTEKYPPPDGDQVGDPHEVRLLQIATSDSERRVNRSLPNSQEQLDEFDEVIGQAWKTILGRTLSEVGKVEFSETDQGTLAGTTYQLGRLHHLGGQPGTKPETLPAIIIRLAEGSPPSEGDTKGTVIWIHDTGKQALLEGDRWSKQVREVLDAGYRVVSADLFGQGELVSDDGPVNSQRMWYQRDGSAGWQRFSGYTYGYNHPLLVKRVHDVLTLIKFANQSSGDVRLVGVGPVAGPLVAAARTQSADAVDRVFIDLAGFRFQNVRRHDDPMFVPGAVKYLDVAGLLALNAPRKLTLVGDNFDLVEQLYRVTDASDHLQQVSDREALISELIETP